LSETFIVIFSADATEFRAINDPTMAHAAVNALLFICLSRTLTMMWTNSKNHPRTALFRSNWQCPAS
jgi:hypothetical protein